MDSEELKRTRQAVTDMLTRGLLGVPGAPVDTIASGLSLLGYRNPMPVGGSEWLGHQLQRAGLLGDYRNQRAENTLSLFATLPLGSLLAKGPR